MKGRTSKAVKSIAAVMGMLAVLAMAGQSFAAKQPPASQVNINTASVDQLMELPGIGKVKAEAIVAYRTKTPFESVSDLTNVRGIGEKLLAKISEYVTVSGASQTANSGTAGKARR